MPGIDSANRKLFLRYYIIMVYTQSWVKTYQSKLPSSITDVMLDLEFSSFIKNNNIEMLKRFLDIADSEPMKTEKKFLRNTSFKGKTKPKLPTIDKILAQIVFLVLSNFPFTIRFLNWLNHHLKKSKTPNPINRRIIKNQYFKNQLK